MAAKKTSFLMDEVSASILDARDRAPDADRAHGQRSVIIRDILRRYDEICRDELPDLSDPEWAAVIEAGRDSLSAAGATSSMILLASILDKSHRLPGADALVQKLLKCTTAQRIAVLDAVERHWAAIARGERPKLPSRASAPLRDTRK